MNRHFASPGDALTLAKIAVSSKQFTWLLIAAAGIFIFMKARK